MTSTSIPKGYKQTEVGVIPEEWVTKSLSQCSTKITDGEHITPERCNDGYYLLSARNILNGCLNLDDVDYVGESEYQRIRQRCNPDEGDILISCSGSIGRIAIVPDGFQCVLVRSAALVKPNECYAKPLYLQFYLQSESGQKQIFTSLNQGAQANLFLGNIQEIKIPLPPFAEQKAIAQVLSDTDALIASLDKLIAKKKAIKQGTMQELLTGRRRIGKELKIESGPQSGYESVTAKAEQSHQKCKVGADGIPEGYKQTEVGVIPEEWEVKALSQLFKFSGGYTASREQLSQKGFCYLHYGDIHLSTKTYIDVADEFQEIPKLNVNLSQVSGVSLLEDGDVVFVDASEDDDGASKHIVVINNERIPYISGLHTIVAKGITDELHKMYRRFCFQTEAIKKQFKFYAVGTKVSGISKTNIGKIFLPIPPLAEQKAIAQVLSDMDSEIAELEQRREKSKALKQGLMQVLLTGKVRLV